MKIAILTSGILPVPAVQGGAVENLIDFYLEYNDKYHLHDITIYSIWHPNVEQHPALNSKVNHYQFIDTTSLVGKLQKYLFKKTHYNLYYDNTIEYYLNQAIKSIKNKKFDLILIENRPGYVLQLIGKSNTKLVIHQGNDYLNNTTTKADDIYNAVSLVINTSDYITSRVRTINTHDLKSKTVLNGIDTEHFYHAKVKDRHSLNIKESEFVIIYSGRLTADKGILPLIQAIKHINDSTIRLLVIGASFYGADKQATPFIKELYKEVEPIKNQVTFTEFVDYKQIPSYLKMGDIAVVPSMWEEPFGLTVVEAMASGLPLITTRSGGIPEICEGVATIVERDNIVNNLTNAILDLYYHPEKRKFMSKAGLERSRLFSKERYAKEFFEALETITHAYAPAPHPHRSSS